MKLKFLVILSVVLGITLLSGVWVGSASISLPAELSRFMGFESSAGDVWGHSIEPYLSQTSVLASTNLTSDSSCTDSDGGMNYEVAGYVEGIGPNGWPYLKSDACESAIQLREFYCNDTLGWPKFYNCPSGCADGACTSETCTDADSDGYAIEGGACGLADCDDDNAEVNPGAAEVCDNEIDDDCDGSTDDQDIDCAVCTDQDEDGFAKEGGICGEVDCDDTSAAVNPGAAEVCDNSLDDDCDGLMDDQDVDCSCFDSDGGLNFDVAGYVEGIGASGWPQNKVDVCEIGGTFDGYLREFYCNGSTPWPQFYNCPTGCFEGACVPETCTDEDEDGFAIEGGGCGPVDCDDANSVVNPNATEVCDNDIDDNCDGFIDANDLACLICTDSDVDGFAAEGGGCGLTDCDDSNAGVYPGAAEICDNAVDDNCNGLTDDEDPFCSGVLNIIVVGWDGTQRDHLLQCYNQELPECAGGLPNIQTLSGDVIFNNTITEGSTETKPGWAQIFTGYNSDITGVYNNGVYQPIPEGYTIFEKIENHFGTNNVVTMFISGKGVHTGGACIGDPTFKNGQPVIEDQGQPWCLTKDHLDYFELDQNRNDMLGNRALELLEIHAQDLFFSLFLFRDPDVTGHLAGEDSILYSEAMMDVDYWLGRIMAKLQELGIDGQTLIYVVTDHGFDEGKFRHMNAPYGFFATNDPLVVRSGDRRDIAPTILERYSISRGAIGDAPAVDGDSLYTRPTMACVPEGASFLDYPGAPACCSGLSLIGLDKQFGGCILPTGGFGDTSGYCTSCGNGICETPENLCNCPADCN